MEGFAHDQNSPTAHDGASQQKREGFSAIRAAL